jgi:gamma-glutamylcyclotransferase (GGCT)/AIG2-like uncharacterized protein YtfP
MMNWYLRHHTLSLNKSAYIGKYQTNDMHFVMLLHNKRPQENYPVVLREKSKHARSIYGEAYSVSPKILMIIDKLNNNNVICKRVREEIFAVGDTNKKKHHAWMYIGMPLHWEPVMDKDSNKFTPGHIQNFKDQGTSFYRFFPNDQSRDLFPKHVG